MLNYCTVPHRTTRHVSVTNDGLAYYERAIRLLTDLDETESAISQVTRVYKGRLRVDMSGTIGRQIIAPALNDFFKRYPEINLEIGCTDRTVDLLQEGIDCAIRGGAPIDESLVARKLIETQPITCASPTYLNQHGTPKTLAELEQHKVVNYFSPRTGKLVGFNYTEAGESKVVFGRRQLSLNDYDACLNATLANVGIAQLPYFSVRNHIESGRLVRVLDDYPTEPIPVYIVYLRNRHLSANVRAFVDWAVALFAEEAHVYQQ